MRVYCDDRNLPFNIMLLVDNFSGHPMCDHPNVKMYYLPAYTTSLIQPMDQGAIAIMKTHYKYGLLEAAVTASKTNKTLIEFLRGFNILDAIYLIEKAWAAVPQSAMYGVWNKLLRTQNFVPEITNEINEIVTIGKSLGLEDIDAESVRASLDVQAETLSNEDLIDWDEELSKEDNTNDETAEDLEIVPLQNLNKEKLSKVMKLLDEAIDITSEFDGNYERAQVFRNSLDCLSKPYGELLKQKCEAVKKQQDISKMFSQKTNEISNESQKEDQNPKQSQSNNSIANLFRKPKEKCVNSNTKQTLVIDLDNEDTEKSVEISVPKTPIAKPNTKLCSSCDDNLEVAYNCKECQEDICDPCYQAHIKVRLTRNHSLTVFIPPDINESKICEGCDENSVASHHCVECQENLCDKCLDAHKKVKLTRHHNLTLLSM